MSTGMQISIEGGIPVTSPKDVLENENQYSIIDVRRPDEFNNELGHIKSAKLVTLGPELDHYLNTLPKDTKIVFVCRSGARSGSATEQSLKLGFKNTVNMKGGMIRWNDEKLPKENQ